jgi:hypothetical protein
MSADLPTSPVPAELRRKAIPPRVWGPVVLGILATVLATFIYAVHEHGVVKRLKAEKNEMAASLDATHSLVAALNNRVNELSSKQVRTRPSPSRAGVNSLTSPGDSPWQEIQAQLAAQQKQIDAMNNTRAMLQASIAHTHDELEAFEKRGQRKYYEFDLGKSSLFRWQGPIALRLQRADAKRQSADFEIMVGSETFTKKNIPLFEPVFVYSADRRQSAELVINGISDGRVHGYVAEAKYRSSGLEAMATPTHAQTTTPAPASNGQPHLQPAKD